MKGSLQKGEQRSKTEHEVTLPTSQNFAHWITKGEQAGLDRGDGLYEQLGGRLVRERVTAQRTKHMRRITDNQGEALQQAAVTTGHFYWSRRTRNELLRKVPT